MSVVKIGNKRQLEQLQAKLTLRLGRRATQQEVLDLCVKLGLSQFESLVSLLENPPILDLKKVSKILERRETRKDIPYTMETNLSEDDSDIYS